MHPIGEEDKESHHATHNHQDDGGLRRFQIIPKDLTHKDGAEPAEFICSSQRIT